jgi:DNA-directed RNA polymerase I subunit RPA1
MSTNSNPIPGGAGGVFFSPLASDEIKRISVKKIWNAPTFDTLTQPTPAGLYDPAMGALRDLDRDCTTCRMSYVHCTGHCGHIELPVPCYHPSYLDTGVRLLKAKCLYCHRLRLPRVLVNIIICKLRLLQYGLLDELDVVEHMHQRNKRRKQMTNGDGPENEESDSGEDEDVDEWMERRMKFVNRAVNKARKREQNDKLSFLKNPAAVAERKLVITSFLRDAAAAKQCAHCKAFTPTYRKNGSTQIFKMYCSPKQQDHNRQSGKKAPNPLLFHTAEQEQLNPEPKPLTNGYHKEDVDMEDSEDESVEGHGAEDEIALQNALETQATVEEEDERTEDPAGKSGHYMTQPEVQAALQLLFDREQEIMNLLFGPRPGRRKVNASPEMFFIRLMLVPPNKYRPPGRANGALTESQQNTSLNRILMAAKELMAIKGEMKAKGVGDGRKRGHVDHVRVAATLQEAVNSFIDHAPNPNSGRQNETGIKQTLEKKEGLFRQNMMGKRVNYAARSVISPDPNIETNEIGVPLVFAKKLVYPEPVTSHNFQAMKAAVENGPDKYPGAAAIENENGLVMNLRFKTADQRKALAKQLMTPATAGLKGDRNKKVYRHLQSGDVVIMNRQPTLHKPSMMGHRARVLQKEKTIRMHYANCNTYNADFDGDEMNMHFPQNEIARSEALQIADTDHQYLSATAGKPLRGLIQDHISMGVQFTSRDVFFDRDQYQELVYSCIRPEEYNAAHSRIQLIAPSIIKPKALWTGKQVISTVLKNIIPSNWRGLNLTSKSSTGSEQWGELGEKDPAKFAIKNDKGGFTFRDTEQNVIFKDGHLLCGILDKAQLGPSVNGLTHSIHELFGHTAAGKLMSILGRLLTRFLNERAWTCGMDDLYLTPEGDKSRRKEINKSNQLGHEISAKYVSLDTGVRTEDRQLLTRLEGVLRSDEQLNGLDQMYNAGTKQITDAITKACLPAGLRKPFPRNQMQAMTISGAKGSNVNANLISCNLGQQVLEGRRVPTMVSGKTLPSFKAYETDPGAGGYVCGRFLTGINPKEYFFHAMSGREGLIDTAVKTSKSGYLQRCIVKGLEGVKTEHDTSVREVTNGTMVQFLYGEDGVEVVKSRHLREFSFLAENNQSVSENLKITAEYEKIAKDDISEQQKTILKTVRRGIPKRMLDPIMSLYPPTNKIGSTSEVFASDLATYLKDNPDRLIRNTKKGINGMVSKKAFQAIMELKYMKSIVEPGEAVGVVAAQSVGEPSTQMTLNTFHLAGHSAKNVTLGIPRLREIVMTASATIMKPIMTVKPLAELPIAEGKTWARGISKLSLAEVIESMELTERTGAAGADSNRLYDIAIKLYPKSEYQQEHSIKVADVAHCLENVFVPKVKDLMKRAFRAKAEEATHEKATAAVPTIGQSVGTIEQENPRRNREAELEGGERDLDEDDDADPEDARQNAARDRRDDAYDDPDDDDKVVLDKADRADKDDDAQDGVVDVPANSPTSATKPKASRLVSWQDDDDFVTDDEERARADFVKSGWSHLTRFKFSRQQADRCRIILSYSAATPKLLLLPILERAARDVNIQEIPGLTTCALYTESVKDPKTGKTIMIKDPVTGLEEEKKEAVVTCAGVNLLAMRDHQDVINPHTIGTNSITAMLKYYGVEAARNTIIKEIDAVFKGHGISVDLRHLTLIADAMTQSGGYKAFSRNGVIRESGSVLAKMSFETVMGFLKEAVMYGEGDPLLGPSARIVAGKRGGVGTGSFDLLMPVS